MVSISGRPWWDWTLFWFAVAGGIKSLIVDPKEKLITVYMIQKRRGVAISREYKRMLYAALTK